MLLSSSSSWDTVTVFGDEYVVHPSEDVVHRNGDTALVDLNVCKSSAFRNVGDDVTGNEFQRIGEAVLKDMTSARLSSEVDCDESDDQDEMSLILLFPREKYDDGHDDDDNEVQLVVG